MTVRLEALHRCFQGIHPSVLVTCSSEGVPNTAFLSYVHYVDPKHIALSCQFFNKTRRNLLENPHASLYLRDAVSFCAYRARIRYLRSEDRGPVFEAMSDRIQAIASHTGMSGVFRLLGADLCEVVSLELVESYTVQGIPADASSGRLQEDSFREVRNLQQVSDRVSRARDLDELLTESLRALDEAFGFSHSTVLLPDESGQRLVATASHGYGSNGVGAEVRLGEGLIGTVAKLRRPVRLTGMKAVLRYGRAIREQVQGRGGVLSPEIPLPGMPDAQSQLGLPLLVQDRLVGVLALESGNPLCFDEWHEAFLQVLGNQIAVAVEHLSQREEDEATAMLEPSPPAQAPLSGRKHVFRFFKGDDCVFVDDEYLIRNVPGKILWKVLKLNQREARSEFSNRELRLDPWLGLPEIRDNLESRLILLRRRLEERCPDVRLVSRGRGRFKLELDCPIELLEQEGA